MKHKILILGPLAERRRETTNGLKAERAGDRIPAWTPDRIRDVARSTELDQRGHASRMQRRKAARNGATSFNAYGRVRWPVSL